MDYIESQSKSLKSKFNDSNELEKTVAESLPESVSQIYSAREAFSSTTQSAFNQILLFYTAGSALLLTIMTQKDINSFNVFLTACLAAGCFCAPKSLSSKWRSKLDAGYDLYAASILHACVLHKALGIDLSIHHWLKLMEECKDEKGTFTSGYDEKDKTPTVFEPGNGTAQSLTKSKHYIAVFKSRPRSLWEFYNYVFVNFTCLMAGIGTGLSILAFASVLYQRNQ